MKLIIITILLFVTPLWAHTLEMPTTTAMDNTENMKMNCPENEEYHECGTACPDTCANKDEVRPCIMVCRSGCFCQKGFVRSGVSEGNKSLGHCVSLGECENILKNQSN
ncbi:hypothetical protein DERP_010513 [Dermatophagoides pteronyssinus]|uniref:TIL domain-containing protein n=1 Tax=Dermatophagoides pteronyssinus TaxID=6956 RepID=A0ABQ8JGC3_DERPT|nr:hypothetical protein DERP_010513 [Dermatophagoides pteronyssinus]